MENLVLPQWLERHFALKAIHDAGVKIVPSQDDVIKNESIETCAQRVVFEYEGLRINIENHEEVSIFNEIFLTKFYDFPSVKDTVLFDIGMNVGMATLYFGVNDNITNIYSFEPFPETYKRALRNLEMNETIYKKTQSFEFGLGRSDKVRDADYYDDWKGCSGLYENTPGRQKYVYRGKPRKVEIQLREAGGVIKSIIDENNGKKFAMKIDCEGAEYEIFSKLKSKNILRNFYYICGEFHFGADRLEHIFKDEGFFCVFKPNPEDLSHGAFMASQVVARE